MFNQVMAQDGLEHVGTERQMVTVGTHEIRDFPRMKLKVSISRLLMLPVSDGSMQKQVYIHVSLVLPTASYVKRQVRQAYSTFDRSKLRASRC